MNWNIKKVTETFFCPVCNTTKGYKVVEIPSKDSIGNPDQYSVFVCHHCGLGQTIPVPDTVSLNRYYQNYYTEQGPTSNQKMLTKIKKTLIKGITFRSFVSRLSYYLATHTMQVVLPAPFGTRKVLDIGCGYGRLLDFFKLQGWETYGVEPGAGASKIAQKNGHKVMDSELRTGIFAHDFFSAAVFCHSLEHIRNPMEVLDETYRILEPGGMIVVEVPNAACADAHFFKEEWHAWHIPFHLFHWTPSSLEAAFFKAGFIIDRVRFKVPKFNDYKNNIKSLSQSGKKQSLHIFWHAFRALLMGYIGSNKKYHGQYIAIYGHKPLSPQESCS